MGKFSFTLQPMCVEVGRVCVDEARDRLQTKTKHNYNMIFSSVIFIMALTALFYLIKKGFCVLVGNSKSECQLNKPRIKELTSLILKALGKKNCFKVSSIERDENCTKELIIHIPILRF